MLGTHPLVTPFSGVLTRLRDWPVTAQQQARRNAMVAATACAQRRIEREEVADFLAARDAGPDQHDEHDEHDQGGRGGAAPVSGAHG